MSVTEAPEGRTVLVADDDPDLVALVARRLSKAGYKVITASDGEEALHLAQEHLPDLAVLDVMMPKLTGVDVTRRLREEPATENILVMLISAGFESDDLFGPPDGADDHLKKPFGPRELPDRVEAVLAR
jgi:DNA-binding response OmpR family regulator